MSNEKKSTQEGKYEDIVTVGFVNPIVDTIIDYAEMGIDAFMTNDVIKEIPIIKTIASVVKVGLSIKEWTFGKRLRDDVLCRGCIVASFAEKRYA